MNYERRGVSDEDVRRRWGGGCLPVAMIGGVACLALTYLLSKNEGEMVNKIKAWDSSTFQPKSMDVLGIQPAGVQAVRAENLQNYGGQNWDCVKIDPANGVPNVFRAVEIAGKPNEWEDPPFEFNPGPNNPDPNRKTQIIYDWNEKSLVYEGDEVCVDP